ncbi:drug/Metabolite transporter superfamily protein [Thecamonas trahens ATCC 50062]|uniref:Drug/Metabolite transporter superfamily protein n=1 Tax=Thecamonas trahens ATCC 50062 TaxID=461836 RepID=A0A0L0DUP6_THETB|nr:drug/Metabolite transporter superfamily protein [Thecamonas trahens ATCC 50062]KNC55922.1 drug/Metabolite transporter superfamily protein [Thecamonas trahens ATCC 50062]|eukprot:XP_013752740.1 drug/Metabolite transporter superfamily protein [Thecamonas trahens ATCC 50062]
MGASGVLMSLGYVLWNVVSSVGLILINKWLMDSVHIECIFMLTSMHLMTSWLSVVALMKLGYEEYKPMPLRDVLLMVSVFFVTVASFNLSLKLNSVGTYQLSKLLVTPVTAALQFMLHGTRVPIATQLSLAIICISVAFVSISDVTLTAGGALCCVVAIFASAANSMWTKSVPVRLGLSTYQVNFFMYPWAAATFAFASVLVENDPVGELTGLLNADLDPSVEGSSRIFFILVTCAMAASLNISSSSLIYYTSALTFHVVGHFKLILILTFGVLFLNSPVSARSALGMVGAVFGVMWYTSIKYREQQAAQAAASVSKSKTDSAA